MPETYEPGIVKFKESPCLECGAKLNAAGSPEHRGALPNPGELLICIKCGAVMMFADDLTPRGMTEAEMDALTADAETMDELARTVARVHLFRAQPATDRVQ
jgi:hypothetical protein